MGSFTTCPRLLGGAGQKYWGGHGPPGPPSTALPGYQKFQTRNEQTFSESVKELLFTFQIYLPKSGVRKSGEHVVMTNQNK